MKFAGSFLRFVEDCLVIKFVVLLQFLKLLAGAVHLQYLKKFETCAMFPRGIWSHIFTATTTSHHTTFTIITLHPLDL